MKNILKMRVNEILNKISASSNKFMRIKIIEKLLDSEFNLEEFTFDDIYNILLDLNYNNEEIIEMYKSFYKL